MSLFFQILWNNENTLSISGRSLWTTHLIHNMESVNTCRPHIDLFSYWEVLLSQWTLFPGLGVQEVWEERSVGPALTDRQHECACTNRREDNPKAHHQPPTADTPRPATAVTTATPSVCKWVPLLFCKCFPAGGSRTGAGPRFNLCLSTNSS